jgi:tRNA1Val (adenine37-N6)-methyltransferase
MPEPHGFDKSDETIDGILQGKLSIIQRRTGYRFSIDALLLAHFVAPRKYDRIVELGAGSGVVALALAMLHPSVTICGVELQVELAARARRSAALNGLSRRVTIHDGNVRAIASLFPRQTFDLVVANPPYRLAASGKINPDREKRVARHEIEARLDDFLNAAGHLLRARGKVAFVYPAARLVDLVSGMRARRLEPKRLRLVHSHSGGEASLALIEASKDGRKELKILPPLTIYTEQRRYTSEVAAILAGAAL